MRLSTVDRLVKKLGPANTLIEKLCERLLPTRVAHAAGAGPCECIEAFGCTRTGYATYCQTGSGTYIFLNCGC